MDAFPVDSIRNICKNRTPGSECSGPWDEVHARVTGQDLTLDNIENDILRPIWKNPLIHYGLSCASYSCPDLCGTAFTAKNTDTLLNTGARKYVNQNRGVDFMEDDFIVVFQYLRLVRRGLRQQRAKVSSNTLLVTLMKSLQNS